MAALSSASLPLISFFLTFQRPKCRAHNRASVLVGLVLYLFQQEAVKLGIQTQLGVCMTALSNGIDHSLLAMVGKDCRIGR